MTYHQDVCDLVIPDTFIMCGEGNNFCSEVCELRFKNKELQKNLDYARRLPNGWPQPTFMSTSHDTFFVEWISDEETISFCWMPDEGAMILRTTNHSQDCLENNDADIPKVLNEWLSK